jgi:hypothetical protein
MPDIGIVTPNPSTQCVTAASNKGPIFDPLAGELHHDGRVVFLSRKRSDLLMLLVRAKGDIVPLEAVEALHSIDSFRGPTADTRSRQARLEVDAPVSGSNPVAHSLVVDP